MRRLRLIRVITAVLFFGTTVAYFCLPRQADSALDGLTHLHPLHLTLGATAGSSVVWLIITLVWGRIYCSTVCPVGALIDGVVWVRRRVPALRRPFNYKQPSRLRIHVLIIYVACVCLGLALVPLIIHPFHIMGNALLAAGIGRTAALWTQYGLSVAVGMAIGVVSVLAIVPYALKCGRDFCNVVCPLGIAMGYAARFAAFRVTIDPDRCRSCGRCQDGCSSSAIKVAGRHVDNTRCVRCFRCVANCPNGAIRYTMDRQRPATPLMTTVKNMRP